MKMWPGLNGVVDPKEQRLEALSQLRSPQKEL